MSDSITLPIEEIFGKLFTKKQYEKIRKSDNWWEVENELMRIPLTFYLQEGTNVVVEDGLYQYAKIKDSKKRKLAEQALERIEDYLEENPDAEYTDEWSILHDILMRMTGNDMWDDFEGLDEYFERI